MTVNEIKVKMNDYVAGLNDVLLVSSYKKIDSKISNNKADSNDRIVFSFLFDEMEKREFLVFDENADDYIIVNTTAA